MKHILAAEQVEVLRTLAGGTSLLAFDFDGTLAPIVTDPERAVLASETRALLAELTTLYPCAVVSGRSLADLAPRIDGLPFERVVGNHGLEPGGDLERYAELVRHWSGELADSLREEPGIELENKRYSLSVHYRRAPDPALAERSIMAATDALEEAARVVPGKFVFNVVPRGAPDKGVALAELRRSLGVSTALYVGDDDTDEDVFAGAESSGTPLVGIRVGEGVTTKAPYYLTRQTEIDELLARLVALRRG